MARSLELIPLGDQTAAGTFRLELGAVCTNVRLGLSASLPVVGNFVLTDLGLAIIARTVPQMNVFVVGYPAKILIGLGVLALALPLYGGSWWICLGLGVG